MPYQREIAVQPRPVIEADNQRVPALVNESHVLARRWEGATETLLESEGKNLREIDDLQFDCGFV
jgi:hypothetical protein